jgi:hypothetical protein
LGRASSVVKESFSKIDTSSDSAEAVKLLKTLLEGVEMTEKQLSEVECSICINIIIVAILSYSLYFTRYAVKVFVHILLSAIATMFLIYAFVWSPKGIEDSLCDCGDKGCREQCFDFEAQFMVGWVLWD